MIIRFFLFILFFSSLNLFAINSLTVTIENNHDDFLYKIDEKHYYYSDPSNRFYFCTIDIENDNSSGFKLTINSANGIYGDGISSKLIRDAADSSDLKIGDYQQYGFHMPLPTLANISTPFTYWKNDVYISSSPFENAIIAKDLRIHFDDGIRTGFTANVQIELYIYSVANDKLLRGPYSDTLTFNLTDLSNF